MKGSQDKSQKENASSGGKGERLGFNRIGFWELGVNPPIHPIVKTKKEDKSQGNHRLID